MFGFAFREEAVDSSGKLADMVGRRSGCESNPSYSVM